MEDTNFSNLITLGEMENNDSSYQVELILNPNHEVFKGHFPERAILPGVIMVEIIKRAVQKTMNKSLTMKSAKNIKFLKMIEPDLHQKLQLNFSVKHEKNDIHVRAQLANETDVFFKEIVTFIEK